MATVNEITNGRVRLCERVVDDGGEWVQCYGAAVSRDRVGGWVCADCDASDRGPIASRSGEQG